MVSALSCNHRLTPAHAGNTSRVEVVDITEEAHPRTHGEYIVPTISGLPYSGSPPHTRGIRSKRVCQAKSERLTPAHTGNTCRTTCRSPAPWAHPRTHGEYSRYTCSGSPKVGSPPHTRGIRNPRKMLNLSARLTPAHTGNTGLLPSANHESWAHPRTHGEYSTFSGDDTHILGSPPHTRGIRRMRRLWDMLKRLTPAHTGNTGQLWYERTWREAHPRTHGEYT